MTDNYSSSPREHPQPFQHQCTSPFRSGLLLILIGILLASCTSAKPPDPVSVVQAAYDRLNKGDVDGFLEFFSDDAVLIDDNGSPVSPQAVRDSLLDFVSNEHRILISDLTSDGNVVTFTCEIYFRNTSKASYIDCVDVVIDDHIIFDGREMDRLAECERDPSQAFCPET